MNTLAPKRNVKTIRKIRRIDKAKKEVVVIQNFEEINDNNSKTLIPLDTQTFVIEYLDGEQNPSLPAAATESHAIQQQQQPYSLLRKQEDEISSSQPESPDCVICKQTFTNSYDKKIHHLKHFGLRPHRCILCMEHFILSSEYYLHRCPESPRRVQKPHPVTGVKEKYPNQTNVFCHLCKKCFCGLNKLKRHETVHSKERPYKCEKCNRSFSQWFGRKNHVCQTRKRFHAKNVDCKTCGKMFQNEITAVIHFLGHFVTGSNNLVVITDNLISEYWSKIKSEEPEPGTNDFQCFDDNDNSGNDDDDDDEDSEHCGGVDYGDVESYLFSKLQENVPVVANEPVVEIDEDCIDLDYDGS